MTCKRAASSGSSCAPCVTLAGDNCATYTDNDGCARKQMIAVSLDEQAAIGIARDLAAENITNGGPGMHTRYTVAREHRFFRPRFMLEGAYVWAA